MQRFADTARAGEELDASVGRILGTVRELGLERKTFVIFTSDNGGPLDDDIGETKNVAAAHRDVVLRLRADATKDDLGLTGVGPGCRPLGRVTHPQPLIAADGTVRAECAGEKKRFP